MDMGVVESNIAFPASIWRSKPYVVFYGAISVLLFQASCQKNLFIMLMRELSLSFFKVML